jgi:hypothetical protein
MPDFDAVFLSPHHAEPHHEITSLRELSTLLGLAEG